jgi:DNA polymerase (family 10)
MENIDIARVFEHVADLLEIQGANPFRIRAYRNAARTVESLTSPVAALVAGGERTLEGLPGIGRDLAAKIQEIVTTGELALVTELARTTPQTLVALLRIPGLGPKRARLIHATLGVKSMDELETAAREGRLRIIKGIGETIEQMVLRGIAQDRARGGRFLLADADVHLRPIVGRLSAAREVRQIEVAGSYRRRKETVGDVDILVSSNAGERVGTIFVESEDVREVLARGPSKCSVVLRSGLQADMRVVPERSFGAALHYFTGSKAHNVAVRTIGVKRGLKINEYGVYRGTRRIAGATEPDVFRAVGLAWIPPELREDRGEIDAALAGTLPVLVTTADIRGDLQMHTTATDGKHSLEAMVEGCRMLGYEYMAVTEHTSALRIARGLNREGFLRQFRAIDAIRRRFDRPYVLKAAEVDILDDGALDLDEATLGELDLVVASVHSKFSMPRPEMTRRIVRAVEHPRVHVLGHPTGRMLNRREPYALDFAQVVAAARDHGVMLEINAQIDRLDLNDVAIGTAREAGVKLVISTDAHRVEELAWMSYGVNQARRGWCTAADIANTWPLDEFLAGLRK